MNCAMKTLWAIERSDSVRVWCFKFASMSFESDLISFEETLHQHGYRVESRVARSFFERADGNVQVAFDQFVASPRTAHLNVPTANLQQHMRERAWRKNAREKAA